MTNGEACPACGFDRSWYDRHDLLRTLGVLAPIWRSMTDPVDDALLSVPVDGASVVEQAGRSRHTVDDLRLDPAAAPTVPPATTIEGAIRELDQAVARAITRCAALDDEQWDGADERITGAVHDVIHDLRSAGRALHALGAGAPHQVGTLVQVNSGGGGVPKEPLSSATVDGGGLVGDVQGDRQHHGAPLQALSLWSTEVMDALNAEGHSLYPGAAGENLTVAGIDWSTIRPGVRLTIGPVAAEISAFAVPCAKNGRWFSDGDFRRINHDGNPGWSRAYAWVLTGGVIAPGDAVVVE